MKSSRLLFLIEAMSFAFVLGFDRILKDWAVSQSTPQIYGPIYLEPVLNFGVMGGSFSHLPVMMKTVTLTSIAAFIFCFYLFSRYFFPMKSQWLKNGLAFMVAGILGNVCDRLIS